MNRAVTVAALSLLLLTAGCGSQGPAADSTTTSGDATSVGTLGGETTTAGTTSSGATTNGGTTSTEATSTATTSVETTSAETTSTATETATETTDEADGGPANDGGTATTAETTATETSEPADETSQADDVTSTTESATATTEETARTTSTTTTPTTTATSEPTTTAAPTTTTTSTRTATATTTATATETTAATVTATTTTTATTTATSTTTTTTMTTTTTTTTSGDGSTDETYNVTVVRIVDGDSMRVQYQNGTRVTVDLAGIDAPEYDYASNDPTLWEGVPDNASGKDWLFEWGDRADLHVRGMGLKGEQVQIEVATVDGESHRTDEDGDERLLVYMSHNGDRINQQLLAGGYARVLDAEFSQQETYVSLEQVAQDNGDGVWSYPGDDTNSSD